MYRITDKHVNTTCIAKASSDTIMESAGTRLRDARVAAGYGSATDAARAMGIKPAAYRHHENETRGIDAEAAQRYGRFYRVSPAWLLWGQEGKSASEPSTPLISNVPAGQMAEIIDNYQPGDAEVWIDYPAKHSKVVALRVDGTSMNRISPDGSIIIVDLLQREMTSNRLYVVGINGEATYKRYKSNPPRLEPDSYVPGHEPIYLDGIKYQPLGRVLRTMMDFE
jgi:SOS-response transcriptional repressor LexA